MSDCVHHDHNHDHEPIQTKPPRVEHREGVRGKWALPRHLRDAAAEFGFRIQQENWWSGRYALESLEGQSPFSVNLQDLPKEGYSFNRAELKAWLESWHQPIEHIAADLADDKYEINMEGVIEAADAWTKLPNNLAAPAPIEQNIWALEDRLERVKKVSVAKETDAIRDRLYRVIGFMTQNSVQEAHLHHSHHESYDEHMEDGCECKAEDMEQKEAKQNASETSGLILGGFRFSKTTGKFLISLDENFLQGQHTTQPQKDLRDIIIRALESAKGYDFDRIRLESAESLRLSRGKDTAQKQQDYRKILLSAPELERFFSNIDTSLDTPEHAEILKNVLSYEVFAQDMVSIDTKTQEMETSEHLAELSAIKGVNEADATARFEALATASTALKNMADSDEMRRIWSKYHIMETIVGKVTGDNPEIEPIEGFCADIDRMHFQIQRKIQDGNVGVADLEAISHEFRDTIAGGKDLLSILKKAVHKTPHSGSAEANFCFTQVESMLDQASLAPVNLSRANISDSAKELAHLTGRHTGIEGVDIAGGVQEFIDDFGGEIVEFVQRNKVLTATLSYLFYKAMTASAQAGQANINAFSDCGEGTFLIAANPANAAPLPAGFEQFQSSTPITLTQECIPITQDELERIYGADGQAYEQCHSHLPLPDWVPGVLHCLTSDQAMVQLGKGYEALKGPMYAIVGAPENAMDTFLAPRPIGMEPFYFVDHFKQSLRATSDAAHAGNFIQNAAHAPWAAITTTMGYKLGVAASLSIATPLIYPVINSAYSLGADNKYLPLVTLPLTVNAYIDQNLSGAITTLAVSSAAAYGLQSGENRIKGLLETLPAPYALQLTPMMNNDNTPEFLRNGWKNNYTSGLRAHQLSKPVEFDPNSGTFTKTQGGLLIPEGMLLDNHNSKNTQENAAQDTAAKKHNNVVAFPVSHGTEITLKIGRGDWPNIIKNLKAVNTARNFSPIKWTFNLENDHDTFELNAETFHSTLCMLTEFSYLLEHMPDKLGIKDFSPDQDTEIIREKTAREHESIFPLTYRQRIQRATDLCIDAFKDFAQSENSASDQRALERKLQTHINTVLAARATYLGDSGLENISTRQQKILSLEGHKAARLEGSKNSLASDVDDLIKLGHNARRSITWGNACIYPVTTGASLGLKGGSAIVTAGKMGLKKTWSGARNGLYPELIQKPYGSLTPKEKGHAIGFMMMLSAIAIRADSDPELHQKMQQIFGDKGDMVADNLQAYSAINGDVAGATTATSLFMVYNFLEDHLLIHVAVGYVCIGAGGSARMIQTAGRPLADVVEDLVETVSDLTGIDARAPHRAIQAELEKLSETLQEILEYDERYLSPINDNATCCDHTDHNHAAAGSSWAATARSMHANMHT